MSETGDSTASIVARMDDRNWDDVCADLVAGYTLQRPSGMRDFYTTAPFRRCLSASRVKKLERDGKLIRVGVDTYGLMK